jgi:flagellar basal-body rod protein FlgF
MDIGTYVTASDGEYLNLKLQVQNNNLANINTVGFKRQFLTSEQQQFQNTFASLLSNMDNYAASDQLQVPGVEGFQTVTDFSIGPIQNTGNPLDVALRGPKDFFVVNTPDGVRYTRAGNFTLSTNGELVTQDGYQVQGDGGAILVNGADVSISSDGTIRADKLNLGRLQVVRIDDPTVLERDAGNRFKVKGGGAAPVPVEGALEPRALEMSNVSAIQGMVDLIVTNRAFEAYVKASQTIDSMNQMSISQVGK